MVYSLKFPAVQLTINNAKDEKNFSKTEGNFDYQRCIEYTLLWTNRATNKTDSHANEKLRSLKSASKIAVVKSSGIFFKLKTEGTRGYSKKYQRREGSFSFLSLFFCFFFVFLHENSPRLRDDDVGVSTPAAAITDLRATVR